MPGAVHTNGVGDPFLGSPAGPLRFASFDTEQFSMYSSNSPSQARHALEAHLKDTDRRIQDASRLGTTLLQQRKDLSARLKEVEQVEQDDEVPADLRKKLSVLEREYNEVGKESARAFLPKSRPLAEGDINRGAPSVLTGQARDSPTKVSAPSRKQRNQPSNRVHDIEFATEISTSLLAQVRQLQAALADKDDALRETSSANAQLEAEAAGMVQRIKHMDDSEQRYKDENWNLETKLQELEAGHREITDKHDRLSQNLKAMQSEKTVAQRELDDLKQSHEKLNEDHTIVRKQQEADLNGLRRDAASHQVERTRLEKTIEVITAKNTELARAVSSRWNQQSTATDSEFVSAAEDRDDDDITPDYSEPSSPIKGTPRHGMLESETLKSSLNHAHRMIQNLKNNIHREKTEKIELKRMLQEARDELESRRGENGVNGGNGAKKRRTDSENFKFKKPARPDRLGANRSSTTEFFEDEPDWEDHEDRTPSKARSEHEAGAVAAGIAGTAAFDHAAFDGEETETTAAFETANERDLTTETEAFETGNEGLPGDESDELTETEAGLNRSDTIRGHRLSPLAPAKSLISRHSFRSTASTSADEEEDDIRTPVRDQQPKYRLRLSRGYRRSGRVSDLRADSPSLHSPSSSTGTPQPTGQSLGDELDALEDDSVDGTPKRFSEDAPASPETERLASIDPETPSRAGAEQESQGRDGDVVEEGHEPEIGSPMASPAPHTLQGEEANLAHQANAAMLAHEHAIKKANMVDAGVMTDPWEPEEQTAVEKPTQSIRDRAGEIVGGALAGFGLGRLGVGEDSKTTEGAEPDGEEIAQPSMTGATPTERGTDTAASKDLAPVTGYLNEPQPNGLAPDNITDASLPAGEPKSLTETVAEPLQAAKEATDFHEPPVIPLQRSSIMAQETEPISPPPPLNVIKQPEPAQAASSSALQHVEDAASRPEVPLAAAVPLAVRAEEHMQDFTFSPIDWQDFEPSMPPVAVPRPMVPRRSSRRLDDLYAADEPAADGSDYSGEALPGTETSRPGAGFLAAGLPPPLTRSRSQSMPESKRDVDDATDKSVIEPVVFGGVRKGSSGIPTLVFGDEDDTIEERTRAPLGGAMPFNHAADERSISSDNMVPVTKPLQVKKPMADGGSQTVVSGSEIEDMMRNKSRTTSMPTTFTDTGVSPTKPPTGRSNDSLTVGDAASRGPRRPASSGSMRSRASGVMAPPLPVDFTQKITAAQKTPGSYGTATIGIMGPPGMPASAYKSSRPRTPAERAAERSMSRDGTTPRPVRQRDSRGQLQSSGGVSRRTSVSSFASELDERFNITRGDLMYPSDVAPATDPRMIQAITQTMIGEYLWKYTRKAGRSETSSTRHRRFFWVHPYTRTLYWSEQDPSTAGRNMLKAKSVAIEAVRVITDDNTYPPGLHRKSLVVVTPGREIVFTAPTGQRHETWFNALSYLLLRTEQEKNEAEDTINEDDINEFNPGFSIMRSISRMTGRDSRGRQSMSSYNSRTARTSSPQKRTPGAGSMAQRQAAATQRARGTATPTPDPAASTAQSRTSTMRDTGSLSGRLSSLTSRFSQRGSMSTRRGRSSMSGPGHAPSVDPSEIYDASVVGDSAEDLRAVIERQEREADRLENVRACCDG